MLLPHRGHRGGGHKHGRPSVSPPHRCVYAALPKALPPGWEGMAYIAPPRTSAQAGMGIYGWDVGLPPALCPCGNASHARFPCTVCKGTSRQSPLVPTITRM